MTESVQKPRAIRGRIFPEIVITPEELAHHKALDEIYNQRCRAIFERVRPELIDKYYGWYIAVEPDSGEYIIDQNLESAHSRAIEKYPNPNHCVFCLNETGATGRI